MTGDQWDTTFREVEAILGFQLPDSARRHQAWWSNTDSHSHATAWLRAGWSTRGVHVATERLSFVRLQASAIRSTIDPTGDSPDQPTDHRTFERSEQAAAPWTQADRIRSFVTEHVVEPARNAGCETVTVRAGDVGDLLGLRSNIPNVCSALGGRRFEEFAAVTLRDRAGPRTGPNSVFTYAIHAATPPSGQSRCVSGAPSSLRTLSPRTAVVFPCAAAKSWDAARMPTPDDRSLFFVADPLAAPANPSLLYRRPDDRATDGRSFRQALDDYNRQTDGNPWGLLPAWRLYRNAIYARMADSLGTPNLFILSAGWGLIRADYLTPDYDITFSPSAERYKRRFARHRFNDFRHLGGGDHDRVLFAGGSDYIPLFLALTDHLHDVERVVYYNSTRAFEPRLAKFVRFKTRTRTNWHYEWAHCLLDGRVTLPS